MHTHTHSAHLSPLTSALQGYLAALGEPEVTQQLLRRFQEATNMTDEISALAALDRAGEWLPRPGLAPWLPRIGEPLAGQDVASHAACTQP